MFAKTRDITLSVTAQQKPHAIHPEPEGKKNPFTWKDSHAFVEIPETAVHSTLVIRQLI